MASSSPRRRELLTATMIAFEVLVPNIDETRLAGETGQELVERLARAKGEAISASHPMSWVIAADTTVVSKGEILEKPSDAADAARMLRSIQAGWHEVFGGIALIHGERGVCEVMSIRSEVKIRAMSDQEISRYVATGEPMDKAGSYAIQGIGAALVEEVRGSYTNVVGLDIAKVMQVLCLHGVVAI